MAKKEINKVRIACDDKNFKEIAISYGEFNSVSERYDSKALNSKEMPMPELMEAMKALREVVISFGELPVAWEKDLTVRGFSMSTDKEEKKKVVIVASRKSDVGPPLNIATPIRQINEDNCTTAHAQLIDEAEQAVIAYINGERSQQVLPLEDEDDQEQEQKDLGLDNTEEVIAEDDEFADETIPSDIEDELQDELDSATDLEEQEELANEEPEL